MKLPSLGAICRARVSRAEGQPEDVYEFQRTKLINSLDQDRLRTQWRELDQ